MKKYEIKKNLSILQIIELFMLREKYTLDEVKEIAEHFGVTQQKILHYIKEYDATTPFKTEVVIKQLEEESLELLGINYAMQGVCVSKSCYFTCHTCKFTASERNIEGIIEHLTRAHCNPVTNLVEQTI